MSRQIEEMSSEAKVAGAVVGLTIVLSTFAALLWGGSVFMEPELLRDIGGSFQPTTPTIGQPQFSGTIFEASQNGTVQDVQNFLNNGISVNAKDENGDTPLHRAALNRNVEVIHFLFSKGADVNVKNSSGCTPFDIATNDGNTGAVEYLATIGTILAITGQTQPPSSQPLQPQSFVEPLLSSTSPSVTIPSQNRFRFTVAEQAKIDRFCARYGSDIKAVDETDMTLLHRAILNSEGIEVIKYLVAIGADVNAQNNRYRASPLWQAVFTNNFEVVKFLVENDADPNVKSANNQTPLELARERGTPTMIQYLSGKSPASNQSTAQPQRSSTPTASTPPMTVQQTPQGGVQIPGRRGGTVDIGPDGAGITGPRGNQLSIDPNGRIQFRPRQQR